MENNIESKKVFSNIWSNIYKIIGGENRFKDYIVCDENGKDLGWLSELDKI